MTFEQFKEKYPHATYADWWNTCAHYHSDGQLSDPRESADFIVRGEQHQQEEKAKQDKALSEARQRYGVKSADTTEKKKGWFK